MSINEKIKYLRKNYGMTQQELAEKTGYKTASAINKIEMGLRNLNHKQILTFAEALHVSVGYLLDDEEQNELKEENEMDIGDMIKNRRLELGLTLEKVGNAVGVGKSTVRKWECGQIKDMKRDKIPALANVLQLPIESFLFCDEDEPDAEEQYTELIIHRLKTAIDESGFSYQQIAKKTGIPKSTLQRWATGQIKRMPIDDIKIIADAIGFSAKWVMGWSEERKPDIPSSLTESQAQLLKLLPDLNEDDIDDLLLLANSKANRHKSQDESK